MWQAETFDPETIERELGWAARLGFTSVRLFLHDLLWQHDREGLIERIDRVLALAEGHRITVLLVLFDGVWDPFPVFGPQAEPRAGIHNSRWVQSPGAEILDDSRRHETLAPYVQGVIERFADDPRVDGWDLFNEPDNPNLAYHELELADKAERALELVQKTFAWARELDPSQPLTVGLWQGEWGNAAKQSEMNRYCLEASDVISFHFYGELNALRRRVEMLRTTGRPLWCTEWLARRMGSCFDPLLPWFRDQEIGTWNWGLVAGRTQTHFPWDSWLRPYHDEPDPWFHEILRGDGSAYDEDEVAFIRATTGARGSG